MQLLEFKNSPMFLSTELVVQVQPERTYFAISHSSGLMREISKSELALCRNVGHTFMCDNMNVLSKQWNHTCLGAIYFHNIDLVKKNCEIHVKEAFEFVEQIGKNTFIIYSPNPQNVIIKCLNGSNFPMSAHHFTEIQIPENCEADTTTHKLFSDITIADVTYVKRFSWDWDAATVFNITPSQISELIKEMPPFGAPPTNIRDLRKSLTNLNTSLYSWDNYVTWAVAILCLLFAGIGIIVLCVAYRLRKRTI